MQSSVLTAVSCTNVFSLVGAGDGLIEPVEKTSNNALQLMLGRWRDLLRRNTPVMEIFEEGQVGRLRHREFLASHEHGIGVKPLSQTRIAVELAAVLGNDEIAGVEAMVDHGLLD